MDIWLRLQQISIMIPPILMAVTVHELAHGVVASIKGDPTPYQAGRLTINPLKHLDFWGAVVFIVTGMIGWAKPVPVNAAHFKNPKKDMFWVALAGPAANILLALILSIAYRNMGRMPAPEGFWFDVVAPIYLMLKAGVILNLGLACFNLIPLPPLDGSHLLAAFLPDKYLWAFKGLEVYSIFILLILIFTRAIDYLVIPPLHFLVKMFLG